MTTATGTAPKVCELARLTAARLASAGLKIAGPDPDDPAGYRLFIWRAEGPYSLTVSDHAHAELQSDHDNPHHAADVAAALLSAAPSDARHPDAISDGGITFKGIAGMDLKAKGFNVALNVYTDDFYYDVSGEIAVTSPAADAGTVYIADDGALTWFRDYRTGTPTRPPSPATSPTPSPAPSAPVMAPAPRAEARPAQARPVTRPPHSTTPARPASPPPRRASPATPPPQITNGPTDGRSAAT